MKKIYLMSALIALASMTYADNAFCTPYNTATTETSSMAAATETIEITDITFANADDEGNIINDFGSMLYASEVKYLKPQITFNGLGAYQDKIKLYVKIFSDDEQMKTGNGSPDGYTFTDDLLVLPGSGHTATLPGWGRNSGGAFSAGTYRFEIWHNGKQLFQKKVRLYSGSTPISESKLLTIKSVSFCNKDKSGTAASSYGSPLYEEELMYVTPRITYTGLYPTTQSATLYYKIFNSDGNLVCGNSSPRGFSSKATVEIKKGKNEMELSGYGSANGNVYKEGVCKVEYWIDGDKIYETSFEVKKKGNTYSTSSKSSSSQNSFSTPYGTLGNLLSHPMGFAQLDMENSDIKQMIKVLKSRYEISKQGNTSFYIWDTHNNMEAINIGNLNGYYFRYYNSNTKYSNHLAISYHWHCSQEANVYEEIDNIVTELKKIGIDIDCTKVNDEYTKMKGFVKIDNIKYTLEVKQYSTTYEVSLEKTIHKLKF